MRASGRSRKLALWAFGAIVLAFLLAQLEPVERTNPPVQSEIDAPAEVAAILKRSCYDCHSHETDWPWYARVAPVSWWVVGHVNEGRGDLNFSQWPVLDFEELEDNFRDIDEQIAKGEMPLKSYLILHPEARLTAEDRAVLRRWAQSNF